METGQERHLGLVEEQWLTTVEVAQILGWTRQRVTYRVRRDLQVTDPSQGLIAWAVGEGATFAYRYKPTDVAAYRNGPKFRRPKGEPRPIRQAA